MSTRKPKVLFFSTTSYEEPIQDSINKKFEILETLATIKIFAYRSKKSEKNVSSSIFHLFKRPKNRFIRYTKTALITFVLARKHFSRADIVVVQDPILSFFVLLSIKSISKKPKVVIESHGDFIETITLEKNLIFPNLYRFLLKTLATYTLKRADCIRVISSSTKEQVEIFTKTKPIIQFPAWIDLKNFLNADYKPEANTVLFLGSISERKNPMLILRSLTYLKQNRPFQLTIIGPHINWTYLNSMNEYIANNRLDNYVTIKNTVEQEEVIDYLSRSSMLILPSKSEGLGRVILEAQAVGCPVLVSDAGGMKDFVDNTKTGFIFKSDDVVDLSEKIQTALNDTELMNDVSILGKKSLLEYNNSNNFINGYKEVFNKLNN